MAFECISAQPAAARVLRAALSSGRTPHACLFLGPRGVGRLAAAREFARVALCLARPAPDECCGVCASCARMAAGLHPDYREEALPEGRRKFPIDTVREMEHLASLTPNLSARRVFVICDAERMSLEAANSFLKTLEEPPANSLFILLASSLRDVPETIVSRCAIVRFARLPRETVAEALRQDGVQEDEAAWLARRSWGSPGAADRFRRMGLAPFSRELIERLGRLALRDNFVLSDLLNANADAGSGSASEARDVLQDLLDGVALYYCDLAAWAASGGTADLANEPWRDLLAPAAGRAGPERFLEMADLALQAVERVGANANRHLSLHDLFTQLAGRGGAPE